LFVSFDFMIGLGGGIYYKGRAGFDAAARFFDVDFDTANYLFDPDEYSEGKRSRSYVIKRIRQVVKSEMMKGPGGRNCSVEEWD